MSSTSYAIKINGLTFVLTDCSSIEDAVKQVADMFNADKFLTGIDSDRHAVLFKPKPGEQYVITNISEVKESDKK